MNQVPSSRFQVPSCSFLATNSIALLFGASGVFGQLQDALNTIWGVQLKTGRGVMGIIKDRFVSFTMVLGISFLLLVSLVLSAGLTAFGKFAGGFVPGPEYVWSAIHFLISFGVITLLFAMIFKVLPDAEFRWRDVWVGAAGTALLFTIGKFALGLYLGRSSVASSYGAAGSVVLILLWVYYSSQILLLGAEFTQVYANRFGTPAVPSEDAVAVTDETRVEQGMRPKETTLPKVNPPFPQPRPVMPMRFGSYAVAIFAMMVGIVIGGGRFFRR